MLQLRTGRNRLARRASQLAAGFALYALGWTTASAQAHCTIAIAPAVASTNIRYPTDTDRIGTTMSDPLTATVSYDCPASTGGYRIVYIPAGFVDNNYAAWYNYGYEGIGVQVTGPNPARTVLSRLDRLNSTDVQRSLTTLPRTASRGSFALNHTLVKVNPEITIPDRVSRIDFGTIYALHSYNVTTRELSAPLATYSINNGLAPRPACRITNPNIDVELPAVSAQSLGAVGAVAGRTSFSIGLTCTRQRADIYITLTDVTTPGTRTDMLTLAADSTAQGIGLRIRNRNGAAVSFGPDSWELGTQNQWLAGNSSVNRNIPMTVEYVATGTVRPGTIRALATFTMSYQ